MANEQPSMMSAACDRSCLDEPSKQNRKKHQLRGGFECFFVEDPPKQLQTECSICLCVLRDPYLVDCCGYSFCRSCIEPIKMGNKLCPLCNVQFTNFMPDKRLQRVLNEMKVYCSNQEFGCQWLDELSKLPQHLNTEPASDSDRLSGCLFVTLECRLCGAGVRRQDIEEHKTAICPQRPYKCSFCNEYESTHEDVTSNHWPMCPVRPVPCRNECGTHPEQQYLEEHLNKDCCNAVVECSFSYAGCEVKLPRKEMPAHIVESLAKHMSLQAENHQRQLEAFSVQVEQLNIRIQEVNAEKQGMLERFQEQAKQNEYQLGTIRKELEMSNTKVKALEEKVKTQERQIKEQEAKTKKSAGLERKEQTTMKGINELNRKVREHQLQIEGLHSHIGIVPVQFTVDDYERLLRLRKSWYSRPFYSHPQGYKMKLNVDVMGHGEGKDTHVSVYVCLMAGEFDDDLKWPCKGCVTIELVDPEKTWNNYVVTINFRNYPQDKLSAGEQENGVGTGTYISNRDIRIKFLSNNCLHFKVSNVDV